MRERVADDVGRVFTGVRRRFLVVRREGSTDLHRRDFDEAGGGFLVREQRRDFTAKILVSRIHVPETLGARFPGARALTRRGARSDASVQAPRGSPPFNSRNNQTFASLQSRCTVCGDTSRAAAVSSTSRPPKKRSSTTRLLRGIEDRETFESVVQREDVDWRLRVRDDLIRPSARARRVLPRFCAFRERATSTSTRRISWRRPRRNVSDPSSPFAERRRVGRTAR